MEGLLCGNPPAAFISPSKPFEGNQLEGGLKVIVRV